MHRWVEELGPQKQETLRRLTKQAVRNHENIRLGSHGSAANPSQGTAGYNYGTQAQSQLQGYVNQIPGGLVEDEIL